MGTTTDEDRVARMRAMGADQARRGKMLQRQNCNTAAESEAWREGYNSVPLDERPPTATRPRRLMDRTRLEASTPVGICATCRCEVSSWELCCRRCGPPLTSAVAPFYRPDEEKRELLPRLEALSDKLCQTVPFILQCLEDAGLTVVQLRTPSSSAPAVTCGARSLSGRHACAMAEGHGGEWHDDGKSCWPISPSATRSPVPTTEGT